MPAPVRKRDSSAEVCGFAVEQGRLQPQKGG